MLTSLNLDVKKFYLPCKSVMRSHLYLLEQQS